MRLQGLTAASRETERRQGFTLVEILFSVVIIAMVFSGVILAYTQASYRAEWTGYSLAAEALAMKQIEQARSARFDLVNPDTSQRLQIYSLNLLNSNLTSSKVLTGYSWTNLDLPSAGNLNSLRATNYVTLRPITNNYSSGTNLMLKVETVWQFTWKTTKFYTNTVCTILAADNEDPSALFGN
jgi:prepilin-type N-terminal cleavage/methylation domain-containing protein